MIDGWASAEEAVLSTVRVEAGNSVGSGFLYQISLENEKSTVGIITNKHVIEGSNCIKIVFPFSDEFGNSKLGIEYTAEGVESASTYHSNPEVDLIFIPVTEILQNIHDTYRTIPNIKILSKNNLLLPSDYDFLQAIENIVVIGYPRGLWDEVNFRPLTRTGVTASDARLDFNGKKEFVIDAEIIGGSSGSPVFLSLSIDDYSRLSSEPPYKKVLKVLGVNKAVFIRDHHGNLIANTANVVLTGVPIGLGICIKSEEILDIERQVKDKFSNIL